MPELIFSSEGLIGAWLISTYLCQANPLSHCRIWEKLAEEGWREEIIARKSMYEQGLLEIKGVKMNRPLGEKGTYALNP